MLEKTRKMIPRYAFIIFVILYIFYLKTDLLRYLGIVIICVIDLLTSYFYVRSNSDLDLSQTKREKLNRILIGVCLLIVSISAILGMV